MKKLCALLVLACCLPLAAAVKPARKASKPAAPPLPGEKIVFTTQDGWTLTGQYQPASGHLTFVLLHGAGSSRGEWTALANRLVAEGYGVLAYDGRGHGESQVHLDTAAAPGAPPIKTSWRKFSFRGQDNEWNQMQNDVEAALLFLSSAGVSSSSLAFCGASIGANVLLIAAAAHPEVRLAVLLSPGIQMRDVLTVNPIRKYGKRPLLLAAAEADKYSFDSALLLYNIAVSVSGPEKALFLKTDKGHGAPMLDNAALMDAVIEWTKAEEAGQPFAYVAPSTAPATSTPSIPSKP